MEGHQSSTTVTLIRLRASSTIISKIRYNASAPKQAAKVTPEITDDGTVNRGHQAALTLYVYAVEQNQSGGQIPRIMLRDGPVGVRADCDIL